MATNINDDMVIPPVDDPDALKAANVFYIEVTAVVNTIMDELRKLQVKTVVEGMKAAFVMAHAMLLAGMAEAGGYLAGAMGAKNQLGKIDSLDKEVDPDLANAQTKEKEAEESISKAENELKKPDVAAANKTEIEENLGRLKREQKLWANDRKALSKKRNDVVVEAQLHGNYAQMAGQALAALPKSQQESTQNIAKTVSSMTDQLSQVCSGAYDKVMMTPKAFWDIHYLAALVALGTIQIR